jgi:hypothetical protein
MNIVMSMDGVLRSDTGEFLPDGLIVYRAFKSIARVVLLTSMEAKKAETWLAMNKMPDFDDLIDNSVKVDPTERLKDRQIKVARSRGSIEFYVDADPLMVAEAMRLGIPALLMTTPAYIRPEFRPDAPKGVRPWDEIVAETNRQQAMKAVDYRIKDPDLANFE